VELGFLFHVFMCFFGCCTTTTYPVYDVLECTLARDGLGRRWVSGSILWLKFCNLFYNVQEFHGTADALRMRRAGNKHFIIKRTRSRWNIELAFYILPSLAGFFFLRDVDDDHGIFTCPLFYFIGYCLSEIDFIQVLPGFWPRVFAVGGFGEHRGGYLPERV